MCIKSSVGSVGKAVNRRNDVKLIQILLNINIGRLTPLAPLSVDGGIGKNTLNAILEFQKRHVPSLMAPDGKIDPGGNTLSELKKGVGSDMSLEKMQGIMIEAKFGRIRLFYDHLINGMRRSQINTPLRMAHFLAQLGHESADFVYTAEIASGSAYEGRTDLGNTQSGDGPRFKGRGLIQLTGRANYTAYGQARGLDYTVNDQWLLLANDPATAADVSCWFWQDRGLNALADVDNVQQITLSINGGFNGFSDRKEHLQRAKFLLGL